MENYSNKDYGHLQKLRACEESKGKIFSDDMNIFGNSNMDRMHDALKTLSDK